MLQTKKRANKENLLKLTHTRTLNTHANPGLVIKARSMFDEPIRIGLIRFADAYDHLDDQHEQPNKIKRHEAAAATVRDFSLSHQPLLVIYTTKTESTRRDESLAAAHL